MYSIQDAYGVALNPSAVWGEVQGVQTLTGQQLAATYREIYLRLKLDNVNTTINVNVLRRIPTLRDDTRALSEIFSTWDSAVELVDEPRPKYTAKKTVYFDPRYAGLSINATPRGGTVESSNDVNDLLDLVVTRPLTDMATFYKRCLFNINGFFYRSILAGNTIVIPEAAKSLRSNPQTQAGVLSFENIADISTKAITEDDFMAFNEGGKLNDGILIKLPPEAEGKSVAIVIGGYLHLTCWKGYFRYINAQNIVLDIARLRLEERYAESHPFLDVGFQRPDGQESDLVIDGEYLRSNEALKKLMTMQQSFFVIIDTPKLRSVSSNLNSLTIPGRFFTYGEQANFLVLRGAGKVMNYWLVHESGIWGIHGPVTQASPQIDVIQRSGNLASLHYHWKQPYEHGPASVLEIIADQLVP